MSEQWHSYQEVADALRVQLQAVYKRRKRGGWQLLREAMDLVRAMIERDERQVEQARGFWARLTRGCC